MCGIAGVLDISRRRSRESLREMAGAMASTMIHRGPDDEGIWSSKDGFCALSHRRLSVIDTTQAGHQPMVSSDGTKALTFNGELYNFPLLRRQAEARGANFSSHSDTEVFLEGLSHQGAQFLTFAEGMFGLGFYDEQRRELLLARDAFGEKPLYYTFQDGLFAFASELKALTVIPGFDASISIDTIASYLSFQFIPAPDTIYSKCSKLPPGSYLRVGDFGPGEVTRYHSFITAGDHSATASIDEQADELEELLVRSLRGRLLSDVPLGAFLSGGIDSTTTVALVARKLNRSIKTFSIGFSGVVESEHEDAQAMARHLGTEHHQQFVHPEEFGRLADLAYQMDEPNADSSCVPTYAISQLAREQVTVALTGDGGDEMFGGYGRYFQCIEAAAGRGQEIAARRWHIGRDYYSHRVLYYIDAELQDLFGTVPSMVADRLIQSRRKIDLDPRPLLNRLREADVENYLPTVLAKVDRMSMLHSLECRTPYLSVDVAGFAAGLDQSALWGDGRGKRVLRKVAERYVPAQWLNRPKKGFGVDPMNSVARNGVLDRLMTLIAEPDCRLANWIPRETLLRWAHERLTQSGFYHAWAFLVLELWLRSHPYKVKLQG
ncbi:asparagine synthase (glutamine-hydrolyzing) [Mangrovitalea sediminis]|uniref:asparagine synthase (glutamine-hydrolyzing) n=1 Tax=Mangrovitalea sediminis TaxID=1982043 RepID=UPI001303FBB1|nr:asparagine synthase (glutamine-hydrolyzing) [Mangrovitalea sediminis]